MPRSSNAGKDWIGIIFKTLESAGKIRRVLDVGVGQGTYSMLGRGPNQEWVGVEIWGPYVKRFDLDKKYDQLIISDVRYVDYSLLGQFDAAFCGDVLEHISKEDARRVMERLLKICRYVFISIPVVPSPQEEEEENPFEAHVKDDWTVQEVGETFSFVRGGLSINGIGVFLLAENSEDAAFAAPILAKAEQLIRQRASAS